MVAKRPIENRTECQRERCICCGECCQGSIVDLERLAEQLLVRLDALDAVRAQIRERGNNASQSYAFSDSAPTST